MKSIRVGVIGVGNMGSFYAQKLSSGEIERATLAAVCDEQPDRLTRWKGIATFSSADTLIRSGHVDAVIIATPHFAHTTTGIAALKAGLHVLVDKPISVHKADVQHLIAAHQNPRQVFAAMLNQRTDGYFIKIKELIDSGALGELRRINWIITNWFRSEAYYASGSWRATWSGEGGGVLLNQCPHQLDVLCWLVGMPSSVYARCHLGKYHTIEVEDDVTALLDFANGATGVFITSTGEAPGTNRLELVGENGKIVMENDQLRFDRNSQAMSEFSRTTKEFFAAPAVHTETFEGLTHGEQHVGILKNFVAAILDGAALIAPAPEGLASVELANAMLMSSFENRTIQLPLDAETYAGHLQRKIATSKAKQHPAAPVPAADMTNSFT